MSTKVRTVNSFFKTAIKPEVDKLKEDIILSDRQEEIFTRYYIRRQDVNFIADTLGVCPYVVNQELKTIREKILKVLN